MDGGFGGGGGPNGAGGGGGGGGGYSGGASGSHPIPVGEVVDLSMEARSRPIRVESIMATDTSSLSFFMSNRLL